MITIVKFTAILAVIAMIAIDSRNRLSVGVRALTELGFAAAFQATSAQQHQQQQKTSCSL